MQINLKKWVLFCLPLFLICGQAQCQIFKDGDYPLFRYSARVGVDAWRFTPSEPEKLLMTATNSAWKYRSTAPWLTFDGQVDFSQNASLNLKMKADQSMGTHVDELNAAWAYSPSFGFNAGVVSYKTSWCRTYDVDTPWVREADPFCNVQSTSDASGGAPGAQMYIRGTLGRYQVQGVGGIYRPLLFKYNTTEFSNAKYPNSHIDTNNKKGLSIHVVNLDTATELRLGLLSTTQSAYVFNDWRYEPFYTRQTYNMVFLGAAFYVLPNVSMRVQTLRHDMAASNWSVPGSPSPRYRGGVELVRKSDVVELNYHVSSKDIAALAVSKYLYDYTDIYTNYPMPGYTTIPGGYVYKNRNIAASWRHDWRDGFFTTVQWSFNTLDLKSVVTTPTVDRSSHAHGLGLRLGYQF